ncbi:TonB-dependent receptor [Henriciella pelagia]|uniref:TonB-dependent receptor n=1 Tax=Henriciella pelagia TaxID=1977912 RepID=A0ABQ1JJA1_9PROT|nr:TonB-dependent receptor [Henriciella pelagia]GGB68582.1 TonB-dependent receptor [Henriciella pelagia]
MNFKLGKLAAASVVSLGIAQLANADVLQGTVTDGSGEASLEGALVTIEGLNRTTSTGRFGDYRFSGIPAGEYDVTVSYIGADPVTQSITVAGDSSADFRLGRDVRYLDNILVVGSAAAQAGAINQQRASNSIISVIDSDGLGNFPDTTVADSLARVPGLSIETDQGEGRYVSIRGINTDLISASINGVRAPSPEDRRGVLLDGVPSDLLDGIEVQKSLTPDLDADSLGGVINLKTISAFDRDGRFFRAKLEGAHNEISEEVSPKATLTYSDTFADTFGVALSVNYQDLRIEAHNNEADEWSLLDSTGQYYLSDGYEHRWYGINRERIGLVANFDWRASESTDLYLRTLFNNYEDDEVRNVLQFRDLADVIDEDDDENEIVAPGSTLTDSSATFPLNETQAEVRVRREVRKIQTIALGGQTTWDGWDTDYEVSYAYAEEDDSDNHDAAFRFEDIQDVVPGNITLNYSNPEKPVWSDGALLDAVYDPANYFLDAFEREFTVNEDTEYAAQFNIARDSLIGQTPVTWKAGLKIRDREKIRDVNILVYEDDSISLADYARDSFISGWRLGNTQPTWPDPGLTRALRGAFGPGDLDEEGSFFDSNGEDYKIDEQIIAGYGMGTFDIGALTLVAGVRIEQTDVDLEGRVVLEDELTATTTNFSNDYTNVLPSVNAKYEFSDRLIGRAAYYAAVVRPAFGEMAPFFFINDDRDEAEIGNPNLDPLEANNFDIGIEFYPTKLSVVSAGVFYKDISNAIFPATFDIADVPGNIDLSGIPAEFINGDDTDGGEIEEVSTFINVGSSEIYGVEFNYVQNLGDLNAALDGFLVSGNLTFTDSEATLPDGRNVPFLKQSDTIWNVAVGYDKGPWDLRVSANYRGDYLDELVDANLDRTTDDRLLVEASAKFDVNDNLQVYLEGKNLTDEPEYYYFGSERRLSQYDEFGTTVVFGARLTY